MGVYPRVFLIYVDFDLISVDAVASGRVRSARLAELAQPAAKGIQRHGNIRLSQFAGVVVTTAIGEMPQILRATGRPPSSARRSSSLASTYLLQKISWHLFMQLS